MPTRIIMSGGPPYCPLCDKRMREIMFKDPVTKTKAFIYTCTRVNCMVSINREDPSIAKWHTVELPKCQLCQKPMKTFFRRDGFIRMQCWDKSHHPYQIMRGDARAMPPVKS